MVKPMANSIHLWVSGLFGIWDSSRLQNMSINIATQLPRYNTKYWLDTFPDLAKQKSPNPPQKLTPLKISYPAKTAPTAEMNHSGELNPRIAMLWNRSRPSLKIIYTKLYNTGPQKRNIHTNINHGNFWFIIIVLRRHVKAHFRIHSKFVFISN